MPYTDYDGSHYTEGSYRRAVLYLVKMRYGVVFIDSHYEQVDRNKTLETMRNAGVTPGGAARVLYESRMVAADGR